MNDQTNPQQREGKPLTGKRPRRWASEIIEIPTREGRREALLRVPENIRAWVIEYVIDHFEKRKHRRQHRGPR